MHEICKDTKLRGCVRVEVKVPTFKLFLPGEFLEDGFHVFHVQSGLELRIEVMKELVAFVLQILHEDAIGSATSKIDLWNG